MTKRLPFSRCSCAYAELVRMATPGEDCSPIFPREFSDCSLNVP
jgi:hypothetical protein